MKTHTSGLMPTTSTTREGVSRGLPEPFEPCCPSWRPGCMPPEGAESIAGCPACDGGGMCMRPEGGMEPICGAGITIAITPGAICWSWGVPGPRGMPAIGMPIPCWRPCCENCMPCGNEINPCDGCMLPTPEPAPAPIPEPCRPLPCADTGAPVFVRLVPEMWTPAHTFQYKITHLRVYCIFD